MQNNEPATRAHTANLLGATALVVSDRTFPRATDAGGVSASGAAALVNLSVTNGLSVTELGRRVGLSQSAAARMVDSLQQAGLVTRSPGDGRQVAVGLTRPGRRTARSLLAAREVPLKEALAVLDDEESARLGELLGKLLAGLYDEIGSTELMCRLCDRAACTAQTSCPVADAHDARKRGEQWARSSD